MAKKKPGFVAEKATDAQINSFEKNYADDKDMCREFMDYVTRPIRGARDNRLQLEDKWIGDLKLWSCVLDDLGYQGRSQIFVPEIHNQIEQGVEKDVLSVFPGGDMVQAIPMNGTTRDDSDKIEAAVKYELEEKARLFIKHVEFERQKRILGTSVYKGGFRKEMLDVFWRDKKGNPLKQQIPRYHGVDWNVVDLFRFYIYPETSDLENCLMVFEDSLKDKKSLIRSGLYVGLEDLSTSSIDPNHQWTDVEQFNMVDLATALQGRPDSVFLTEVWCDFEFKGKWVPMVATLANMQKIVRLTRNPYWFQRHPYLAEKYVNRPGKIWYGFSMFDKLRGQQYMMNDVTNHTMDSLTFSLNPISIVDPALAGDVNSMKVHPGAKWLGSPEGIKPYIFPDVSQSGLRAVQEIRGQVAQFSDNSPGLAPQLEGKARSATQASIVQQNVSGSQRVKNLSEELSILGPMCKMTHSMLVQYMEEEWQIKYQGPDAGQWIVKNVKPNDIIGEVDWVWKGASAQEKTAVRSQQLLAFFNQAMQVAGLMPGEVDLASLFKRIAREAFDLRDLDEIFKSLRMKKTIDQEVENIALWNAEEVPVHNGDNDDEHIRIVNELIDDPDAPQDVKLAAMGHRQKHEAQKAMKQQLLDTKAKLQAMQSMGPPQPPGQPGQGQPPMDQTPPGSFDGESPMGNPMGQPQIGQGFPGVMMGGRPHKPPSPLEGNHGQVGQGATMSGLMTGVKGNKPNLS